VRGWLDSFFDLVVLGGKKAGIGLALIGCVVAALVENDILGWIWSLLLVALLNFAGAGGLVFLAIKRRQDLLFSATRRQLGLKSVSAPSDG
jgi:hypothetical protein